MIHRPGPGPATVWTSQTRPKAGSLKQAAFFGTYPGPVADRLGQWLAYSYRSGTIGSTFVARRAGGFGTGNSRVTVAGLPPWMSNPG